MNDLIGLLRAPLEYEIQRCEKGINHHNACLATFERQLVASRSKMDLSDEVFIAAVEEMFGCSFAQGTPRTAVRTTATVKLPSELANYAREFETWLGSRDLGIDVVVKVQHPRRTRT